MRWLAIFKILLMYPQGDLFSDLQTKESKPTEPAPVAKPGRDICFENDIVCVQLQEIFWMFLIRKYVLFFSVVKHCFYFLETLPSDVKKKPPYGGVSLFPGKGDSGVVDFVQK